MDKTQNLFFTLFRQDDFLLTRNVTLLYEGVSRDWSLDGWTTADYDLLICLDGEALYEDDRGKWHILPGKAYLARPGIPVRARLGASGKYHVLAQHFTLKVPGGADALEWVDFPSAGILPHFTLAREYAALQKDPSPAPFLGDSLFRAVLWDFLEAHARRGGPYLSEGSSPRGPLEAVMELARLIRETDPEDGELERLQGDRGFSPVYIRDLFKSRFGKTPRQYRTDLRFEKARRLLREGLSVKETAWACGFSDELYFSRAFRKREGMPPGRFASAAEI